MLRLGLMTIYNSLHWYDGEKEHICFFLSCIWYGLMTSSIIKQSIMIVTEEKLGCALHWYVGTNKSLVAQSSDILVSNAALVCSLH